MIYKVLFILLLYKFIFSLLIIISILISMIFKLPVLYKKTINTLFTSGFRFSENFKDIPDKPCIIMSNYAKDLSTGYIVQSTFPKKYRLIMNKGWPYTLCSRVFPENSIILVDHEERNNYKYIREKIVESIHQGYYVFCYIEDIRKPNKHNKPYSISKLRSGIFSIAKQYNIPIVPMVIDYCPFIYSLFYNPKYRVKIGESMYVEDVIESIKDVQRWMKKNLNIMKINPP